MSIKRFVPRVFLVVPLGAALVLGCGGGDEAAETPEKAATSQAAPSGQAAAPPAKPPAREPNKRPPRSAVSQLKDQVPLPDNIPADVPRYPGSWASQVRNMPNGLTNIMYGSDDPSSQVVPWIAEFVEDNGWQVLEEETMSSGQVLRSQKGGRVLNIITSTMKSDDEDVTLIAVIYSPED